MAHVETRETSSATRPAPSQNAAAASCESRSICITCNLAPNCIHFIENPSLMIWDCENFDDYVEPTAPTGTASPDVEAELEDYGGRAGLCVNCAERQTCTYPRPPGGVWHCAEYGI